MKKRDQEVERKDELPPSLSQEEETGISPEEKPPFVPESPLKTEDADLLRTSADPVRKFRRAQDTPLQDTPPHLIENPDQGPRIVPSLKSLDSNFEPMLRAHLTQPVSDAARRPPITKHRNSIRSTNVADVQKFSLRNQ
jgi:hypothetical protein